MPPSIEGLYIVETAKTKTPDGLAKPSDFLGAVHPISARAAKFIDSKAFFCKIPKGKHLVKAGQVCPYIFMVHKGLFRGYINEGKNEITTWITTENDLVSSISSFFNQVPSMENIQALEDCELTGVYHSDLETAYIKFPELNISARKILQITYRRAEERAYLTRISKASNRLAYFTANWPDLLTRVSLKYIASHLGITLETLSRLRGANSRHHKEFSEKTI